MEKKFSKIQIAAIKRTAQNVAQFVNKKERINAKIAELEAEKASYQPMIDAFQGPIKEMTGGYTTEDLVKKEVIKTGKFDPKTGKEIIQTRYALKYPETVIPPTTEDGFGSDYDLDKEKVQMEAEHADEMRDAEYEEVAASLDEEDPWA